MASLNKVMLIGNLTRDPEVRYLPKGTAVAEIGLAMNRVYTSDTQERREEVTFVDVTMFGRTAELAGQYLAKGRSIFVEGRLQLDQWEDKTSGQTRNKLRVVAERIEFLGQRDGQGQGGGGGGNSNFQPRGNQPSGGGYQGGGGGGGYQGGGGGGGFDSEPEGYGPPSGGGGGGGGSNYRPQQQQPAAAPKQQPAPNFAAEEDDDIPF